MMRAAAWLLAAAALGGCSTLDKLNPFSAAAPKVKMAELQAIQPSATLATLWQGTAGAAGEFVFTPAVAGAGTYVAAGDGTLARYDGGQALWRVNAGVPLSGGVGADAKRVVVGTRKGEVIAFDAAGKEVWRTRVSSEVLAAPAVAADLVVVRSGDSRVFGFDAADGKRRWVYQRSTPSLTLRSQAGVTLTEGAALVGFPGGKLVAISLGNGAALWEATVALPRGATELERVADVASAPVVVGKQVCAAAYQGRVACFELASGNALWARDISSTTGLDADARHVYVTDDTGTVHALDLATGASVWRNDKLLRRGVTRPLVVGAHVAVADAAGMVHLLDSRDGAFAARAATDGSAVLAAPVAAGDAFLVQTAGGGVFGLAVR